MKLTLLALLLVPAASYAQSAQRAPGLSWQQAAQQAMNFAPPPAGSALAQARGTGDSVVQVTDTDKTFPWQNSLAEMKSAFILARDSRVIPWRADFARRPSWLYPDDGCYARAVIAADTLKRAGFPAPGKIFAFGNLSAQTSRTPSGTVSWWYHVAVAYRYEADIYVFDPSVEEKRPLKMQDWVNKIRGSQGEVKISLCDTKTYNPADNCRHGNILTTTSGFRDQMLYLDLEWDRLLEMGKDPASLLGEQPLWE